MEDKDIKEFLHLMIKDEVGDNPSVSYKCKEVLERPITKDLCYDFRGIRQWVLCNTWKLMEEKRIPFAQAIRESWRQVKDKCIKVGAVV